ncbi:MAG: hypothetical protein JNM88_06635 [Chitinophagaceae bacterium]|nr:hypothetical protein [Chitinophagaceae bacterium]
MQHRFLISLFLIALFLAPGCSNEHILKEVKTLDLYPSASAIEYTNGRFYIAGDDASYILIADSSFAIVDSIALYSFSNQRISKAVKPDIEAAAITIDQQLLLTGSGSLSPYRNIAWFINPDSKVKDSIRLDTFYNRLLVNGIKEINIEGCCFIPGSCLLANRGSKGYPKNQLVFAHPLFWQRQSQSPVSTALLGVNSDSSLFSGVSGMDYAPESDRLVLTISTEDTRNSLDDGAIGKSYLWIIKNISSKRKWSAINPDKIIDLEKVDTRFKGQKIESVCVIKETKSFIHLALVADNDKGSSTLFRLVIHKD